MEKKLPNVAILMAVTRAESNPEYVKMARESVHNQTYPHTRLFEYDNDGKFFTIGKVWNELVRTIPDTYEWVFFLGDDDHISDDMIHTLVHAIFRYNRPNLVQLSTNITVFDDKHMTQKQLAPTGMWLRKYLLENPFREDLTKFVDVHAMDLAVQNGKELLGIKYHYGYYYRSHPEQTSGQKFDAEYEHLEQNKKYQAIKHKIGLKNE